MSDSNYSTSEEVWKPIPGFLGYDVSDKGRVRSYWNGRWNIANTPQKFLKPGLNSRGYPMVVLSQNGKGLNQPIHRLVLLAFVGKPPQGYESRHLDGVRTNCFLNNLCWGTRSENMIDRINHGFTYQEITPARKLTNEQVLEIRELHTKDYSQKHLTKMFDVSVSAINNIINRKTWKHL